MISIFHNEVCARTLSLMVMLTLVFRTDGKPFCFKLYPESKISLSRKNCQLHFESALVQFAMNLRFVEQIILKRQNHMEMWPSYFEADVPS